MFRAGRRSTSGKKCVVCGRKVSVWELKRYNGMCAKCFATEINKKKHKPIL